MTYLKDFLALVKWDYFFVQARKNYQEHFGIHLTLLTQTC